jgi:nucleotide-binding universal stress UspA family protein
MFKKILVATDASPHSVAALRAAVGIARAAGSEIVLLNVVSSLAGFAAIQSEVPAYVLSDEEIETMGSIALDETLKHVDVSAVPLSRRIETGFADNAILRVGQEIGCDLIVMGTKGHNPLAGALLGSITQRVVGMAHCPVMVVKQA